MLYDNYTRLYSPENSFVKMSHNAPNQCSTDILTCLPYLDEDDLSFQLKIRRGWIYAPDWEDDIDTLIASDYKIKATTSCVSGSAISGAISPFANREIINKRVLNTANRFKVQPNPAYECTDFNYLVSGSSFTLAIANLSPAAAVAFLQTYFSTNKPELLVAVTLVGSDVFIWSSNSNFTAVSITTRHLVGPSYVFNSNAVVQTLQYVEYELTLGYDFIGLTITSSVGQNFVLSVVNNSGLVGYCSNCFCPIDSDYCYTTRVKYYCDEVDSLSFTYGSLDVSGNYLPAFKNVIRLPFYLAFPQFPEESEVYRRSSGNYQKISSLMECTYEVATDYMPKEWHKCLAVALAHDHIQLVSSLSGLSDDIEVQLEEKYQIDWIKARPQIAVAPAAFKVKIMPFNNYNSNLI